MSALWHIRVQRDDWRAYREWLVWPLTFTTERAAQLFMERCFTFKGIIGRKVSASVVRCGDTRRGCL